MKWMAFFLGASGFLLVYLKATGQTSVSWVWVTLPFWAAPVAFAVSFIFVAFAAVVIASFGILSIWWTDRASRKLLRDR